MREQYYEQVQTIKQQGHFDSYFHLRYATENPNTNKTYLPIYWHYVWWTIHGQKDKQLILDVRNAVENIYNGLDPTLRYFTVTCGVHCNENLYPILPSNVEIYCGGYNDGECDNLWHAIPYYKNQWPRRRDELPKDIFCFYPMTGDYQGKVRDQLNKLLTCNEYKGFSHQIFSTCRIYSFDLYAELLNRSKFVLCPRGTNPGTFRFYEAMECGAIPVYISNQFILPYQDEVNWDDCCVRITPDQMKNIPEILSSISDDRQARMRKAISSFVSQYLTYEKMYKNIIKHVGIK